MREKGEGPLSVVRVIVVALPLLLKLLLVFLKYKRVVKKRKKIFKKTLEKEGLPKEVVARLCSDLPEVRMREMISNTKDSFIPFN